MATKDDIDESQQQQDKGIKLEFVNVHQQLEKQSSSTAEGFHQVDLRFDQVDVRFDQVDGRFDQVDLRLDQVDVRLDQVDGRFDQVDVRLDQVDGRFDQVDVQFREQRLYMDNGFKSMVKAIRSQEDRSDKIEERLDMLSAAIKNSRATQTWSNIEPVGVYNNFAEPGNRYHMPQYFPNKVAKFWHLQRPQNHDKLIGLLRFYDIQDLGRWKQDLSEDSGSESDPERPSRPVPTLEETVKTNPTLALSRLAEQLGLNYEKISINMRVAEQYRRIRPQGGVSASKRGRSGEENEDGVERDLKKLVIRAQPGDFAQTPSEPLDMQHGTTGIGRVPERMSVEEYGSEKHEMLPHVGWANESLPSPTRLRDHPDSRPVRPGGGEKTGSVSGGSSEGKLESKKSPPRGSKASTVPFEVTPSIFKAGQGRADSRTTKSTKDTKSTGTDGGKRSSHRLA